MGIYLARSFGMSTMEGGDKRLSIGDIRDGFPSTLFTRIVLPLDQVLQLAASDTGVDDVFDFVFRGVADDNWRRRRRRELRGEGGWFVRGQEGFVKDGMDLAPRDRER